MNSFYKSRATPLRIWMSLSYLKPAENVLQWLRLSIGYTLLQPLTVYKESLQCICMTISVLEYDYFAYRSYASTTEFLHYFTICVALLSWIFFFLITHGIQYEMRNNSVQFLPHGLVRALFNHVFLKWSPMKNRGMRQRLRSVAFSSLSVSDNGDRHTFTQYQLNITYLRRFY